MEEPCWIQSQLFLRIIFYQGTLRIPRQVPKLGKAMKIQEFHFVNHLYLFNKKYCNLKFNIKSFWTDKLIDN